MFLYALPIHSFMEINALRPSEFPGAPQSIIYYAGAHWTLFKLKIERTDLNQGPRIAPSSSQGTQQMWASLSILSSSLLPDTP